MARRKVKVMAAMQKLLGEGAGPNNIDEVEFTISLSFPVCYKLG